MLLLLNNKQGFSECLLLFSIVDRSVQGGSDWARMGQPICRRTEDDSSSLADEGFGNSIALVDLPGSARVEYARR